MDISASNFMPAVGGFHNHEDVYGFGGTRETKGGGNSSRNLLNSLSGKFMPTKTKKQVERAVKLAIHTAHSPFLRPFELLNLFSNHLLGEWEGIVDSIYEKGYKFFPHKYIGKSIKALKNLSGISKKDSVLSTHKMSGHWLLKKLNIQLDDNLAEELVKSIGKIYDPDYLKSVSPEFVNEHGKLVFFTKALKHGDMPYVILAEHIVDDAFGEFTKKATSTVFGSAEEAISNFGSEENHEDVSSEAEVNSKLNKKDSNVANKASNTNLTNKQKTDIKKEMAKAKTARDKAQIAAKYGIDSSFDAASNVASKAGSAVKAAKEGVEAGVQKVTNGTKNLNFIPNSGAKNKPQSKKDDSSIVSKITGAISGFGQTAMDFFKKFPIPGLGNKG